jgi:hypothetical protein
MKSDAICILLPPFQILRRFGFFNPWLCYAPRYIVKVLNIEISKRLIIWNGGSNYVEDRSGSWTNCII